MSGWQIKGEDISLQGGKLGTLILANIWRGLWRLDTSSGHGFGDWTQTDTQMNALFLNLFLPRFL